MMLVTIQLTVPYEEKRFDRIDERIKFFLQAGKDEMDSNDNLQRNDRLGIIEEFLTRSMASRFNTMMNLYLKQMNKN